MSGNSKNNQKRKRMVRNASRRKEGCGPILEGTDFERKSWDLSCGQRGPWGGALARLELTGRGS